MEELGFEDGSKDVIALGDGRVLSTHGPSLCSGQYCCIHNPSDHPLKNAPMVWIGEVRLITRRCECGALHPDPDAMAHMNLMTLLGRATWYDGWHRCCPSRCCEIPDGSPT